jgi:hypothetical protein
LTHVSTSISQPDNDGIVTTTWIFTALIPAYNANDESTWGDDFYLRVNPIFDWKDERELFDPAGDGSPLDDDGELLKLEITNVTWSGKGTVWSALGNSLTANVEIKDGAIVQITTDSNNDGTINTNDNLPSVKNKSSMPGRVVRVNGDDDDTNGEIDKWQRPDPFDTAMNPAALAGTAPSVTVQNEDDLAETRLYVWVETLTKTDGTSLYFDVYSIFPNDLVMWTASTKGSRIHRGVVSNNRITESTRLATLSVTSNTFTRTVYMEANNAITGTVTLQAMPVLSTNASAGYDSVKINGITFGFTPYTPQTEYINPMPIPEKNWKENEVGIRRNGDYDCGSSIKDWGLGTATANEDDLIRLDISITAISGIVYRLKTADSAPVVRLWNSPLKGGYPLVTYSGDGAVITESTTVYAEYVSVGNTTVTFELVAFLTATGEELFTEEIVFRPFESITAAFVGEHQTAGLIDEEHGINVWVKDMLLEGYDVHVWDDGHDWLQSDDCDEWGEGAALNEIANAINNRGVTEVVLVGYSHGGGSVYNLSKRLYYDGSSCIWYETSVTFSERIHNTYQLVFTSYIDAIRNGSYTEMESEDRKPEGTLYHLNQFQTNTGITGLYLNGTPTLGGTTLNTLNIDRTDDLPTLYHSTIDDDYSVQFVLREYFQDKTNR